MTRASTHGMTIFHCWWLIRHGSAVVLLWLPVLLEGEVLPSSSDLCCWTVLTHCTAHREEQALLVLGVTLQPPAPSPHCTPRALSSAPPWSQSCWPCLQKMGEQQRWENSKEGHKCPAICPVDIPTQHIYLCDATITLPFSNRKPERITHIHLVKDAGLFTVISYC